jgi:hypothetical protein
MLQLLPAWQSPPLAAVNAKKALLQRWFGATHQLLLLQQQQQQHSGNVAAAADQAKWVAALLKGLPAAHVCPPQSWLQLAVAVLTQHLEAHSKCTQQQQQQQCLLGPEDLSRVVLALSKLGHQPEEQAAQTLLLATQVC